MSNNVNPTKSIGGENKIDTTNQAVTSLLREVLEQLKIMNVQFSIITGDEINKGDIQ